MILATLEELGYNYNIEILNAKYFGVPQNRERLFIVAWHKGLINAESFHFPYGIDSKGNTIFNKNKVAECARPTSVSDIFEPKSSLDSSFTISDRMWAGHQARKERNRQNGKRIWLFSIQKTIVFIAARYQHDIGKTVAKFSLINQILG